MSVSLPGIVVGIDKTIAIAKPPFKPPHHIICFSLILILGSLNMLTADGTSVYIPAARATNTSTIATKIVSRASELEPKGIKRDQCGWLRSKKYFEKFSNSNIKIKYAKLPPNRYTKQDLK